MRAAALPPDEEERLHALSKYQLLDTANDKIFKQITELASVVCEVPIALLSVIDKNSQWFLSNYGFNDAIQTPRDLTFCGHVILGNKLLEIKDAQLDERFADNPFVTGNPNIRFYAGVPLVNPEGFKLGTLCVIDQKPKELNEKQRIVLELLSKIAITIFETRRGILSDLNTLMNSEANMSELEKFKSAIVKSISGGIITISKHGQILFTNDNANRMFEYSPQEFLQKNLGNILKNPNLKLENNQTITTQAVKKDKTMFPVELTTSSLAGTDRFVLVIKEQENNASLRRF